MGCGSSNTPVVADGERDAANGNSRQKIQNGGKHGGNHDGAFKNGGANAIHPDDDNLSTVFLPDDNQPPVKPPLAFEIPIEEFIPAENLVKKHPPKRVQQLEEKLEPVTSLQDIEEKQAEAESRRLMILQQRVASASKRGQKAVKALVPETKIAEADNMLESIQMPRISDLKDAITMPDMKLR